MQYEFQGTPFRPSKGPVLRLDARGRAVAGRRIADPDNRPTENPWVAAMFAVIDTGRVRTRNLIIDRTGGTL